MLRPEPKRMAGSVLCPAALAANAGLAQSQQEPPGSNKAIIYFENPPLEGTCHLQMVILGESLKSVSWKKRFQRGKPENL